MSVLVWVMGDGEHQDMLATCRAGDGKWLTFRWDYRDDHGMIGFRHDFPFLADDKLTEWTEELEANGSVIIADPKEMFISPPEDTGEIEVMRWWNFDLRPMVMSLELEDPADSSWDEECTLSLPPADPDPDPDLVKKALRSVAIECVLTSPIPTFQDLYSEKLSWGP